ncbi:MAG: FkbM family methyltransferase [Proteobacteria bacterium]|nr:FkbM family methyltransferase [Pseudomonadota bacterium]
MIPTPHQIVRNLVDNPNCVIFDVGANHGQSTEIYRVLFEGSTIHAFEPQRAAFETMKRRIGGLERVYLNQIALGEQVGSAQLHVTTHAESSSLLPLNADSWWAQALDIRQSGTETVAVDTIDRYCAERAIAAIDFLKLDVQGFEPECLRGAARMLAERRIGVIQAEIVYHRIYQRATRFTDIETLLDPYGYRLYTLFNVHVGDGNGELLYLDAVLTRP